MGGHGKKYVVRDEGALIDWPLSPVAKQLEATVSTRMYRMLDLSGLSVLPWSLEMLRNHRHIRLAEQKMKAQPNTTSQKLSRINIGISKCFTLLHWLLLKKSVEHQFVLKLFQKHFMNRKMILCAYLP